MLNDTNFTNNLVNVETPACLDKAIEKLSEGPLQTLADLWYLSIGEPISLRVEKRKLKHDQALAQFHESIMGKAQQIPPEKRIEPPTQVAGQALEDSKFCIEADNLREMFANLIANSMNVDYAEKVHPSFSKIIQQMSPLDAQMIQLFRRQQLHGGIAIVNYQRKLKTGGFTPIIEGIPAQMPEKCTPELAARSILSLQRLELIRIPADGYFSDESLYAGFQHTSLYQRLNREASASGCTLDMEKHIAYLTVLGSDFLDVCCG